MWASVPWNSHGIPCFLACSPVCVSVCECSFGLHLAIVPCAAGLSYVLGQGNALSKSPLVDLVWSLSLPNNLVWWVCLSLSLSPSFPLPFFISETVSLCSPGCHGTPESLVAGIKGVCQVPV